MYSICCNLGFSDKQENVVNFEEYLSFGLWNSRKIVIDM